MIVVADASPFVGLIKIGCIDVLPGLYDTVVVPTEVWQELSMPTQAVEVRSFTTACPAWLLVRSATTRLDLPTLDPGEAAAIGLAIELKADLLIIDESLGRQVAIEHHVPTVRTAAVLYQAAVRGVLPDLATAFARLKRTNFRVPHAVLDRLLEQFESRPLIHAPLPLVPITFSEPNGVDVLICPSSVRFLMRRTRVARSTFGSTAWGTPLPTVLPIIDPVRPIARRVASLPSVGIVPRSRRSN